MKLPVGIDDYKKLIQQSYDHVDKTLFVRAFLDENAESTLITRPRRFGKTLNMSMLYYFLSNQNVQENRQLFAGKKIEAVQTNEQKNCMDLQGQYPVIFITFKNIRASNFEEAKQQIAFKMAEAYREHRYLATSDALYPDEKNYYQKIVDGTATDVQLQQSLKVLSEYLQKHYNNKTIILLDEYDTPFHAASSSQTPYHGDLSDFMKIFIGAAFKGNPYLEKGMLTGILRVSLMDLFSGANSIPVMSMLTDEYEEFFGFTPEETQQLIGASPTGIDASEISSRLNAVTKWYNGYRISNTLLYNPWSVISYLYRNFKADVYWNASGEDSTLGRSLLNSGFDMQSHLVTLLKKEPLQVGIDDQTVFAELTRSEAALWGLMLYSGYLKVVGDNGALGNKKRYQIAIPNFEVEQAYEKMVAHWFLSIGETAYHQLFKSLQTGDLATFKQLLEYYLERTVSYHDLGKKTLEKVYHVMFLGMFFMLDGAYTVDSNKEYGLGRYDIILIPQNKTKPGYIFEFKATDNPEKLTEDVSNALQQITEARYSARLQQEGVTQAHHIGIAFCGKQMQMGSALHNYQPQPTPPAVTTSSTATLFATAPPPAPSSGSSDLGGSNDEGHKDKKPRYDG